MAWPLLAAGIGMSVLGGIGNAISSLWGGDTEEKIAEYNAQIAEMRAQQAEYQAEFGMYKAQAHRALVAEEIRRKREEVQEVVSGQKVSAAHRGVAGSVSAMEAELDTLVKGAVDVEMIGWKGDVEAKAMAYESRLKLHDADVFETEATWEREMGRAAKAASKFGAVTSLLGMGGQVGGMLSQYNWKKTSTGTS